MGNEGWAVYCPLCEKEFNFLFAVCEIKWQFTQLITVIQFAICNLQLLNSQ